MAESAGWNGHAAIAKLRPGPWAGRAWRFHHRRYEALDAAGSLLVSGRYNRGRDQFPADETWPALYLALGAEIALGEIIRHVTPELFGRLNDFRLSEIEVQLASVIDCRDAATMGLVAASMVRDYDFDVTQELAAAAIARHAEAILVPSATGLGDNLIVFPDGLSPTSQLVVLDSRDPRLYAGP